MRLAPIAAQCIATERHNLILDKVHASEKIEIDWTVKR
jgi:hypothetical protein